MPSMWSQGEDRFAGYPAGGVRDEAGFAGLLEALDTALETVEVRGRLIMWDRYHGRMDGDLDQVSRDRSAILLDPRVAEAVGTWAEGADDPGIRQRAEMYRRAVALARASERPEIFERRNAL